MVFTEVGARCSYLCSRCSVQTSRGVKCLRLYTVCKNSVDNDDPRCINGGYLRAKNITEQTNCAVCECPKGWGGVDCSGMPAMLDPITVHMTVCDCLA